MQEKIKLKNGYISYACVVTCHRVEARYDNTWGNLQKSLQFFGSFCFAMYANISGIFPCTVPVCPHCAFCMCTAHILYLRRTRTFQDTQHKRQNVSPPSSDDKYSNLRLFRRLFVLFSTISTVVCKDLSYRLFLNVVRVFFPFLLSPMFLFTIESFYTVASFWGVSVKISNFLLFLSL
jgi:hypothetical protein